MATDFTRTFLVSEGRDLRAAFGAEHLVVELTEFMKIAPVVASLQKYLKRVLAMHAAVQKF